jgi:hypothetical protein
MTEPISGAATRRKNWLSTLWTKKWRLSPQKVRCDTGYDFAPACPLRPSFAALTMWPR